MFYQHGRYENTSFTQPTTQSHFRYIVLKSYGNINEFMFPPPLRVIDNE